MRCTRLILAVWAALAGGACGGCHDPAATKATAVRQERMRYQFDRFAEREADGWRRVRESVDLAQKLERRHAELRRRSSRRWAKWWRHDLDRWEDGQPDYRRRIDAEFEGDQTAIEAAFRRMFY